VNHTHLQLVEKLCKWCGLSCLMTTCRARCHLRRFPGCSAPPQHHLSLSPCPAGAQTCLKRQLRILVQHPARMASLSSPCPLAALLCMPCPAGRPLTGQLALSRYALSSILSFFCPSYVVQALPACHMLISTITTLQLHHRVAAWGVASICCWLMTH